MSEQMLEQTWLRQVRTTLQSGRSKGGFIVVFPEYRPDLVLGLANALGLVHFDFRRDVMSPLGWQAGKLHLDDLDRAIVERSRSVGLVVQNVEALLSTKSAEARSRWLKEFLLTPWPNQVILPMTLYAAAVPQSDARVTYLDARDLPEPTLFSRLAF